MRRTWSVSLLLSLVTGILVLVLVVVFTLSALAAYRREREAAQILASAKLSHDIVLAREALRVETGWIDAALAVPLPSSPATLDRIGAMHARSMAALAVVAAEMGHPSLDDKLPPPALGRALGRETLRFDQFFPQLLAAARGPLYHRSTALRGTSDLEINAILGLIDTEQAALSRQIASYGPYLGEMMRINDIAWHVRVVAGNERGHIGHLISHQSPPDMAERSELDRMAGRIQAPWGTLGESLAAGGQPAEVTQAIADAQRRYFHDYARMEAWVLGELEHGRAVPISRMQWLSITNPVLASLMQVSRAAILGTEARAQVRLNEARRDLAVALLMMAFSIGLAVFAFAIVHLRVIRPLKALTGTIAQAALHEEDEHFRQLAILSARRDEIGHFARALKARRQAVAERQRLEGELVRNQAAKEAAEAASRLKSEFLANMSHELRTPLNAVIGFSELMLHKTFGPLSERYEEYAELIHDAGNHLLSLVSDILDLAKIEAGRFAADFQTFDINACASQCLALIRPRAQERDLKLIAQLPEGAVELEADPRACKQILLNLLSNAVKFSQPHGEIHLGLASLGEEVELWVRDEGIGIPEGVLARIGQPFEQASNNPMLAREGTGLGLALVKALVREHGGRIMVESQEGVGTRVIIRLPRRQQARARAA